VSEDRAQRTEIRGQRILNLEVGMRKAEKGETETGRIASWEVGGPNLVKKSRSY
jgi:hypothetical protein